jgi:type II secretory pathway component PulC
MEGTLNIKVKHLNDKPIDLQVDKQSTVFNVKEQLSSVINVPATEQKLIFKGRILKDDEIAGNVLEEGGAIHAVHWDNAD